MCLAAMAAVMMKEKKSRVYLFSRYYLFFFKKYSKYFIS